MPTLQYYLDPLPPLHLLAEALTLRMIFLVSRWNIFERFLLGKHTSIEMSNSRSIAPEKLRM